jgi:predicted metal-dependent enzyme (double-stranded beta helix superfamily)
MRAIQQEAQAAYGVEELAADLRAIAAETDDPSRVIQRVRPLVQRMALDKRWVRPEHYQCDAEQGFGVHLLHEEAGHALAIFAVSWLPGRGAPPHNHATWAVVAGVDGPERNTFYKRADDGSRNGHAELVQASSKVFREGEVLSLLPDGIHSVLNEGERISLSLHVYGKHINYTGRSTYDLGSQTEKPFVLKIN